MPLFPQQRIRYQYEWMTDPREAVVIEVTGDTAVIREPCGWTSVIHLTSERTWYEVIPGGLPHPRGAHPQTRTPGSAPSTELRTDAQTRRDSPESTGTPTQPPSKGETPMPYTPALEKAMEKVRHTPRTCKHCAQPYQPTGPSQMYCPPCSKAVRADIAKKRRATMLLAAHAARVPSRELPPAPAEFPPRELPAVPAVTSPGPTASLRNLANIHQRIADALLAADELTKDMAGRHLKAADAIDKAAALLEQIA